MKFFHLLGSTSSAPLSLASRCFEQMFVEVDCIRAWLTPTVVCRLLYLSEGTRSVKSMWPRKPDLGDAWLRGVCQTKRLVMFSVAQDGSEPGADVEASGFIRIYVSVIRPCALRNPDRHRSENLDSHFIVSFRDKLQHFHPQSARSALQLLEALLTVSETVSYPLNLFQRSWGAVIQASAGFWFCRSPLQLLMFYTRNLTCNCSK